MMMKGHTRNCVCLHFAFSTDSNLIELIEPLKARHRFDIMIHRRSEPYEEMHGHKKKMCFYHAVKEKDFEVLRNNLNIHNKNLYCIENIVSACFDCQRWKEDFGACFSLNISDKEEAERQLFNIFDEFFGEETEKRDKESS